MSSASWYTGVADAYGIEKSVASEEFIEASQQKLRELMERPLGNLKLCAVMMDQSDVHLCVPAAQ